MAISCIIQCHGYIMMGPMEVLGIGVLIIKHS